MLTADLKVELDQCMRKNRELAESNRESMKQYTKLKMQYEKVMSKSTFASAFAKPQLATETVPLPAQVMYTVSQKPAHTTGTVHGVNNRIGVGIQSPEQFIICGQVIFPCTCTGYSESSLPTCSCSSFHSPTQWQSQRREPSTCQDCQQ